LKTRDIYNVPAKLPKEFVIIDFETTGLDASQDEIVQFGGLRVKGGVVTDEIEFLVNTFIPINPNAQAVHGITKDLLVKYGVSQKEAFKKINEFINDSQMMAYNAVFDAGFLDVGADRYGYFFRKRRMICLLRFSRKVWPDLRNHKLQTVVDNIGSGKLQKHTALSDCYMAYDVYCAGVEKANAIQASTYQ
jgi:DNA polymerase III alpha subunit (gram-positive type)